MYRKFMNKEMSKNPLDAINSGNMKNFWEKFKGVFLWKWFFSMFGNNEVNAINMNDQHGMYKIQDGIKLYANAPYIRLKDTNEPTAIKNIVKDNRFAVMWAGDVKQDLNNGCNEDIYRYIYVMLFVYRVPIQNVYLLVQKNDGGLMKHLVYSMEQHFGAKFGGYYETTDYNVRLVLKEVFEEKLTASNVREHAGLSPTSNVTPPSFLYFLYSGHGANKTDYSGDELDGKDEFILTGYDTLRREVTYMLDDELNSKTIGKLPPNCNALYMMDQCYSGTSMDLNYVYKLNTDHWEPGRRVIQNNNTLGNVLMYSAASDAEVAWVSRYNDRKKPGGTLCIVIFEDELNGKPLYTQLFNVLPCYSYIHQKISSVWKQDPHLSSYYNQLK